MESNKVKLKDKVDERIIRLRRQNHHRHPKVICHQEKRLYNTPNRTLYGKISV